MRHYARMNAKLLLSKREAAQALSISLRGLEYLISRKELVARRVGRRVLIPTAALEQFVRRDHTGPLVPQRPSDHVAIRGGGL